jgi:hypothetical protein
MAAQVDANDPPTLRDLGREPPPGAPGTREPVEKYDRYGVGWPLHLDVQGHSVVLDAICAHGQKP